MTVRETLQTYIRPMKHRPPPRPRVWIYAVVGYAMPVIAQVAFPGDPALTDELVWLLMLGPAFLLALHYGIRGAFVALILGTSLFITVQFVVAMNFTPDDWRVTVPTFIAYGTLAVGIGWLSEELHDFYCQAISRARLSAIGQMAVTVAHHLNNDLTMIVTEADLLLSHPEELSDDKRKALTEIRASALRASKGIEEIDRFATAPVSNYLGHSEFLDLTARPEIMDESLDPAAAIT